MFKLMILASLLVLAINSGMGQAEGGQRFLANVNPLGYGYGGMGMYNPMMSGMGWPPMMGMGGMYGGMGMGMGMPWGMGGMMGPYGGMGYGGMGYGGMGYGGMGYGGMGLGGMGMGYPPF